MRVPLPRPAGLVVEKLLTERSSIKGERDLLVALALMTLAGPAEVDEVVAIVSALAPDLRAQVRRNLVLLSLARAVPGMPDPEPHRALVASFLERLEAP